jgi:hypothetical protein
MKNTAVIIAVVFTIFIISFLWAPRVSTYEPPAPAAQPEPIPTLAEDCWLPTNPDGTTNPDNGKPVCGQGTPLAEPSENTAFTDLENYQSCDNQPWYACQRLPMSDFEYTGEEAKPMAQMDTGNPIQNEYQPLSPYGTGRVLGGPSEDQMQSLPGVSAWDNSDDISMGSAGSPSLSETQEGQIQGSAAAGQLRWDSQNQMIPTSQLDVA